MSDNPPPPPPPPPYNAPPPSDPYQSGPYQQPTNPGSGLAITALVLGILSLPAIFTIIGGIALGLVAVVVGIVALSKIKKGTASGRGMAITGVVLGVIGAIVSIVIIIVAALFVNSGTGKDLRQCLNKAGNDTSAQQQCQDEFRKKVSN